MTKKAPVLREKLRHSPFFLERPQPKKPLFRYVDKYTAFVPKLAVSECIDIKNRSYFPPELSHRKTKKDTSSSLQSADDVFDFLERLENQEEQKKVEPEEGKEKKEEEDDILEEKDDDEEAEEGDYGKDYYDEDADAIGEDSREEE
eukprot:TRINITY_DN450_c0_g1_i1.p1 TRINITY_DN450_c0_g1~~TRINITY_DN450_c0_g1_i1.p1  ORF type:complete len:162 (+),score=52.37 TRINITY_DN450_c0_g1_i1:49-486(+)